MRLSPCLTALVLVRPTPLLVRPTPLLHTRVRRLVATEEPIADFAALASRIAQVRAGYVPDSKAVILRETLVPGQRLRLTAPPPLVELFTRRDGKPIVLLGQQGGKQQAYGVEATLEGSPEFRPVSPVHPEGTADICIAAGRVCEVLDSDEGRISVSRQATIRWIDLDDTTGSLPTSNPSASPPPNTTGSLPTSEMFERSEALEQRVQEWLQMVRSACRERTPTHLEDVMADLGPMPEAQRPNARLINPLPSLAASSFHKPAQMGPSVAPEIRPSVLLAPSTEARLRAVDMGLSESMRRLAKVLRAQAEE